MPIFFHDDFDGFPKSLTLLKEPYKVSTYIAKKFVWKDIFYKGNYCSLESTMNGFPQKLVSDRTFIESFHADYSHFCNFEVEINGMRLHDFFEFVKEEQSKTKEGFEKHVVTLSYPMKNVLLRVITILDGSSFLTRYLEIENTGKEPFFITGLYPMSGILYNECYSNSIRSEATRPNYYLGTFKDNYYLGEGEFEWIKLPKATIKLSHEHPMFNPPFYVLKDDYRCAYTIISLETSMMTSVEFTKCGEYFWGRNINNQDYLHFKCGVDKKATYRMVKPNETVESMRVHIGSVIGDLDDIVNEYYEHLRLSIIRNRPTWLTNPVSYTCSPHDCCQTDKEYMLKEIDKALELGAEIFLMDAGWFGSKDKWWYQVRGDYYENELLDNSMAQIFDIARSKGLKIGLWVEIEGINLESELYKKHPEWVIKAYNNDLPTLNLMLPEVREYLYNELTRIIEKYNIDVFRIDGGLKEPSEMICNNEIIETSWEYYEHLFNIFEKVREKHSNVYFENCSGGAGRSDLAIMKRFDWMSLTDLFEVVSSLRVAYGLSLAFLPEQMHTSTTLTNISKGNELFATRIAMFGHFTIHGVIDRMNE